MKDIEKAKECLKSSGYTCVLYKGDRVYTSTQRGVKPLLGFYESDEDFCGFAAADKVVGAGAAQLYVLLGVAEVWAEVVSLSAERILKDNNIIISAYKRVENIINRTGDGFCPIETAVKNITEPQTAYEKIKQTLRAL